MVRLVASVLLIARLLSLSNAFTSQPSFVIPVNDKLRKIAGYRRDSLNVLHMAAFESVDEISLDAEERMEKSVSNLNQNLQTIRTGRASPAMLDLVMVDYYETPTPLNQVAGISVTSSQQLTLTPYDKTAMEDIERGIIDSGLGLTPNNDGNVIRINIPDLTEERRKEFMKQCKALGEDGKVAIRNVRRDGVDAVKKMEKAGSIGKDEMLDGLDEMQKITDTYVKSADDAVQKKESELMKL